MLVFVTLLGCAPPAEDETWARVQSSGVLRVGMDAAYPPFETDVEGTLQGYDIDLADEIGRRLGVRVEFVNVSFDGLYDALAAGRCDVLISALPYERQRTKDVLYTGGYFNAGQVLLVRAGSTVTEVGDLAGRAVAVEMGSQAHQEALRLRQQQGIDLAIKPQESGDAALARVVAGEADAAILDAIAARAAVRQDGQWLLCGDPLTDDSFVIATRNDSPELFAHIDEALDTLRGAGWLDELAERWL